MNSTIDTLLAKLDAHPRSLLFARLADAYLKAERMDQAIEICEQGLSHYSDYVNGHVIMGKCYVKVGLLEQAKAEFQQALQLDNEHAAALFHLGDIHREEKKYALAVNYYQQVLQKDPANESVQVRMSQLKHHSLTRTADVGSCFEEDTKSFEHESIYTTTLAEIYASQGLTERAIHILRRVLEHDPKQEEVLKRIQELEDTIQKLETGGDNGHNG